MNPLDKPTFTLTQSDGTQENDDGVNCITEPGMYIYIHGISSNTSRLYTHLIMYMSFNKDGKNDSTCPIDPPTIALTAHQGEEDLSDDLLSRYVVLTFSSVSPSKLIPLKIPEMNPASLWCRVNWRYTRSTER
jgi:hypothetical protein